MADWGGGFTSTQPLPNPPLSRVKCNFQLTIQKKKTEVSLGIINFVLHEKQLSREQSAIYLGLQEHISSLPARLVWACQRSAVKCAATNRTLYLPGNLRAHAGETGTELPQQTAWHEGCQAGHFVARGKRLVSTADKQLSQKDRHIHLPWKDILHNASITAMGSWLPITPR